MTSRREVESRFCSAGPRRCVGRETGSEFFVITDGQAQVRRPGKKVATLGPGRFFGDPAVLDTAPLNASVKAETPMVLVVLRHRDVSALIEEVPGFARRVMAGLAHRLREADAKSLQ